MAAHRNKNEFSLMSTFLDGLRGSKKSLKTVSEYFLDLQMFFRYLKIRWDIVPYDTEFEEIDISDIDETFLRKITRDDFTGFTSYLASERFANPKKSTPGLKATTINRKLCSLHEFFEFLSDDRNLFEGKNPMVGVKRAQVEKLIPEALTLDDTRTLLNHVKGRNETRDYCILLVALTCGLRVSEIVGLNLQDILLSDTPSFRVLGKGSKQRNVPMPLSCLEALESYLAIREKEYTPSKKAQDALFLSTRGNRMSVDAVQYMVRKTLLAAPLKNSYTHLSPHLFRHTAATNMLNGDENEKGKTDIRVIQEFLGHSSLSTTQVYTKVKNKAIETAVNSSPFAEFCRKTEEDEKSK